MIWKNGFINLQVKVSMKTCSIASPDQGERVTASVTFMTDGSIRNCFAMVVFCQSEITYHLKLTQMEYQFSNHLGFLCGQSTLK